MLRRCSIMHVWLEGCLYWSYEFGVHRFVQTLFVFKEVAGCIAEVHTWQTLDERSCIIHWYWSCNIIPIDYSIDIHAFLPRLALIHDTCAVTACSPSAIRESSLWLVVQSWIPAADLLAIFMPLSRAKPGCYRIMWVVLTCLNSLR